MNNAVRIFVVCAIACTATVNRSDAQKKSATDLSGTWQIHFRDDNGVSASAPKLIIRQTGDKLEGFFGNQSWPIIGAVDGNTVIFTFTAFGHEKGGVAISDTVFYWGAIDNASKMRGRMKNPKEAGEWVASKE